MKLKYGFMALALSGTLVALAAESHTGVSREKP